MERFIIIIDFVMDAHQAHTKIKALVKYVVNLFKAVQYA